MTGGWIQGYQAVLLIRGPTIRGPATFLQRIIGKQLAMGSRWYYYYYYCYYYYSVLQSES
jgi:hypothetical protein